MSVEKMERQQKKREEEGGDHHHHQQQQLGKSDEKLGLNLVTF